jgi:hypothetical protein
MSIKVNCRILEQSGGSSGRKRLRRAQPGAEAAAETAAHGISVTISIISCDAPLDYDSPGHA